MALDEPKDTDKVYEEGGLKFLVDNDLQDKCGAVKVDFIEAGYRSGFSITSANPLSSGGSCGTCSGSCG